MAPLAEEQSGTLRYWFRRRYNLSPQDPRYLSMTDFEIEVEYETSLAEAGASKKACHECGVETFRSTCPNCKVDGQPLSLSGDALADRVIADLEAGKDIDLNKVFLNDTFEEISPEEITHGSEVKL